MSCCFHTWEIRNMESLCSSLNSWKNAKETSRGEKRSLKVPEPTDCLLSELKITKDNLFLLQAAPLFIFHFSCCISPALFWATWKFSFVHLWAKLYYFWSQWCFSYSTPLMFALGPAKAAAANSLHVRSCYTSFAQLPFSELRDSLLIAVKWPCFIIRLHLCEKLHQRCVDSIN